MKRSCISAFSEYRKAAWIWLLLTVGGLGLADTPPKTASVSEQKAAELNAKDEVLSLPLSFEANQGQTDAAVKFLSRGNGYALFLTSDSAVFKVRSFRENSSPV